MLQNRILKFWYQLQYRFKMVQLVWWLYYSNDIFMLDIQTDPIEHLPIKNLHETSISNISVSDSKYRSGLEIPTPTSPSV